MEDKTLKKFELGVNDCLDKAEVCPADSDDNFRNYDHAEKMAKILIEEKKIDSELELESKKIDLELKKLELEQEKLKAENSIVNPRLWVEGLLFPTAIITLRFLMISVTAINSVKFEQQDMATLSISKGVGRYVVDGIASLGRDR